MTRKIIIAICGKTAVGKDTLAKALVKKLQNENYPAHLIVHDTTRPPRANERQFFDYYFMNPTNFKYNVQKKNYIETSYFKEWFYGTRKTEIQERTINVGVFNPIALESLRSKTNQYVVVPIYLDESFFTRMRRSRNRENGWKKEHFRRMFADFWLFLGIKKTLRSFKYYFIIEDMDDVLRKTDKIYYLLSKWGLLDKQWWDLGNFQ